MMSAIDIAPLSLLRHITTLRRVSESNTVKEVIVSAAPANELSVAARAAE
jgi:hypothetical protein